MKISGKEFVKVTTKHGRYPGRVYWAPSLKWKLNDYIEAFGEATLLDQVIVPKIREKCLSYTVECTGQDNKLDKKMFTTAFTTLSLKSEPYKSVKEPL